MTNTITFKNRRGRRLQACIAFGVAWALTLAFSSSALAARPFEQVQTWAGNGSALEEVEALAINASGAGGVTPGTVFAVVRNLGGPGGKLLTYKPNGDFVAAKSIGSGVPPEYTPVSIAVDQANGDIFVLYDGTSTIPPVVEVFSPNASSIVTSFGQRVLVGGKKTIEETPGNVHTPNAIAVDEAGTVYISDGGFAEAHEPGGPGNRIMVWKPGGSGYEYTGRANDVAVSEGSVHYGNQHIALDAGGNIYLGSDEWVFRFNLSSPTTPTCEGEIASGGLKGMTVDPDTGEVFYDDYKDGKGHQLTCNEAGEFVSAAEPFKITPRPTAVLDSKALAFNPNLVYGPGRAPGVLYGANSLGLGYVFAEIAVHAPVIQSESVQRVTPTTAKLSAQVNPEGPQTSYLFQYLGAAAYEANDPGERFAGAIDAPLAGAILGGGLSPLTASVVLTGLSADTEYRYRVIATNSDGIAEGQAQAFRTFPVEAPKLPDKRAWELVSPADKQGGEVFPADASVSSCGGECKPGAFVRRFPMQSSPDGESVVYEGFPFTHGAGALTENEYLSKRTDSGWQTTTLSPSLQSNGSRQGYQAFSADLSQGLLYQVSPSLSPAAPSGFANFYLQPGDSPSELSPLLGEGPPNREAGLGFELIYAGASADFSRLFFEANDALTSETAFAPEAEDGGLEKNNLYEWANGQLTLVNVLPGNAAAPSGAAFGGPKISNDGSRVFWTSEAGQVYVRDNGESTEAIPDSGAFAAASADGSRLLLNDGHLFDVDDLAEAPVDLTEGQGGFKGVLGQSEDLSRIYFADTAALAPGAEPRNCASAGAGTPQQEEAEGKVPPGFGCNLYLWEGGTVSFIGATLAGNNSDWSPSAAQRSAEASPSGEWLAFSSTARLTGYDNTGPFCLADSGTGKFKFGTCREAFLFNGATGQLTCASCNPTNAEPIGSTSLAGIEGAEGSMPQPRYLTDSGRLYFDTRDSLSQFDTNNGVEDVYQYEPEDVGTCEREEGCISLISAGHETTDSNFLSTDTSGRSVFFTTRDQLSQKDRDQLVDLYVAREDGGIASESETARTECQGEACQPQAFAPNDPTPASSSFEGAGNVEEQKAKKHAKKHKKKHAKKKQAKKHAHGRAAKHNRGGAK
jgi:hypothetical protein